MCSWPLCVSLVSVCVPGPRGTKGSVGPSLTGLGLCRSLGRWQGVLGFVLGTGAVSALRGKGQMEGKRLC